MAFPAQKWPKGLGDAVGRRALDEGSRRQVWREIQAGTLPGWDGAIDMPYSTVCYYADREEKRRRIAMAKRAPMRKSGTIAQKVDRLAHRMLDMSDARLTAMVEADKFDATEIKEMALTLATLRRAAPDKPPPENGRRKEPERPADPLEAAVAAASQES